MSSRPLALAKSGSGDVEASPRWTRWCTNRQRAAWVGRWCRMMDLPPAPGTMICRCRTSITRPIAFGSMEARIQARVHHAIHVGDHRLCLGSRSVVAERRPGFPSRRRSDAGELAMDLVRHHADEPNSNGDRTTIGRKRLPSAASKMEQPSCGTDRPGSCSDPILPLGAGVGKLRPWTSTGLRGRPSQSYIVECCARDCDFVAWRLRSGRFGHAAGVVAGFQDITDHALVTTRWLRVFSLS